MDCSWKIVQNCLRPVDDLNTTKNKISKPPPKKKTEYIDCKIPKISMTDPLNSFEIQSKLKKKNITVSISRQKLYEVVCAKPICVVHCIEETTSTSENRLKALTFVKQHLHKWLLFMEKLSYEPMNRSTLNLDREKYRTMYFAQYLHFRTVKYSGSSVVGWIFLAWYWTFSTNSRFYGSAQL